MERFQKELPTDLPRISQYETRKPLGLTIDEGDFPDNISKVYWTNIVCGEWRAFLKLTNETYVFYEQLKTHPYPKLWLFPTYRGMVECLNPEEYTQYISETNASLEFCAGR